VDERARAGIFLAFQYPVDIPGVSIANFLRTAVQANRPGEEVDIFDFQEELLDRMQLLEMDPVVRGAVGERGVQRRREEAERDPAAGDAEPALAVLDETDSGLDIDALKVVAAG
jgi:Fe-S cluster assembly ATP-binding protein